MDMEIAENEMAARKRLRILEAKAQTAENQLEISRIELRQAKNKELENQTQNFNNVPQNPNLGGEVPNGTYSITTSNGQLVLVENGGNNLQPNVSTLGNIPPNTLG